ncbi:ras association domain-containing protein 6-like [Camarhynchus parvulus]|uniref:ras association domain-containing protein 6-like n=1 Tax=Geospiza parvula TaxID=87175 RepID=UPI001237F1D9|nr:ras association domain-containing protein 6-like [Camarhynchus parvulus]
MKKVTMKAQHLPSVFINEEKFVTREHLSYLLKNYNSYYSDQENLQLTYNQQEGSTPFIEGILSIFWGVWHPIRLKIQDEKQIPSFVTLKSTENVGFFPGKRGMTRWGEFADLHHISGDTLKSTEEQADLEQSYPRYESHTLRSRREQELDCATLPRSSSDAAAVRRRTKLPTITRTEVETHRFSINGHFYNHETSVFTPAFGSETKIRINSQMRSRQVIEQLLRKFKIENSLHEFALYIIHASGDSIINTDYTQSGVFRKFGSSGYTREKRLIQQHLRSRSVQKTETTV